jgi:hypothetical protein
MQYNKSIETVEAHGKLIEKNLKEQIPENQKLEGEIWGSLLE